MDSLIHSKKELLTLWSAQLFFALVTIAIGAACEWLVSRYLFYSCEQNAGIWVGALGVLITSFGLISLKSSFKDHRKAFFYAYIFLSMVDIICYGILINVCGRCFKYWSAVSHYSDSQPAVTATWINMALLFVCLIHVMCCVFSYIILLWDCCCWCKWTEADVKSDITDDQEL